ncbi:hypothetical protein IEN85_23080 [Pelagicoccus sp. NFK12]|uniref:Cbb3-type cytochrome c oxidase subunit 3 n=1 Tax=Pelagicoccus enzymogenes TaxID=2773457 RepID=A0A927FC50_9BACT|nr:hypothetical protein [Pelagicoccus enzymogenes]MBD5782402.1 hypothetical protein [Pelagicoccus enzymogenes]MDQ8200966.1 hypothetical protein [Pelagicoccus enzymogenes]
MFQRVEYTEWHTLFPKIGFVLFFLAFGIIVWKALKMGKNESSKASRMPLDD